MQADIAAARAAGKLLPFGAPDRKPRVCALRDSARCVPHCPDPFRLARRAVSAPRIVTPSPRMYAASYGGARLHTPTRGRRACGAITDVDGCFDMMHSGHFNAVRQANLLVEQVRSARGVRAVRNGGQLWCGGAALRSPAVPRRRAGAQRALVRCPEVPPQRPGLAGWSRARVGRGSCGCRPNRPWSRATLPIA